MGLLAIVLLVVAVSAQVSAQEPYRQGPIILNDVCLAKDDLTSRAASQDISDALSSIASRLINGSRSCLDMIYVIAFTSNLFSSETTHPHNIEVVAAGQKREISLPDRPGDYESHKGDIWKLSIFDTLRFLPGSCIRVCNIQNVAIVEGGNNGWNIDSILTYGCTSGLGCAPLTQDFDVLRWVDGNGPAGTNRFTLTKVSKSSCSY